MVNLLTIVIPAQAGIQGVGTKTNRTESPKFLGSSLRWNDERGLILVASFIAMSRIRCDCPGLTGESLWPVHQMW